MARNWYTQKANDWDVAEWKETINNMTHFEIGYRLRFDPPGISPIFTNITGTNPVWVHFLKQWNDFGGWIPGLSEAVDLAEKAKR